MITDPNNAMRLEIKRARELTQALRKASTEIPEDLNAALQIANIRYTPDAVQTARQELSLALTGEEFRAASAKLADAFARESFTAQVELAMLTEAHTRVVTSLRANEVDLFDALAKQFNSIAPGFEQACRLLPDLGQPGLNAWQLTTEQAEAIRRSQELADELDQVFLPYRRLASQFGYISETPEKLPDGLADWVTWIYILGKPTSDAQAMRAAQMAGEARLTDQGEIYKPVMPYASLVFHGIPLELSSQPENAQERRIHAVESAYFRPAPRSEEWDKAESYEPRRQERRSKHPGYTGR